MASFPRTRLDAVLALCGRPQAEAVMMFGHEDHILHSGGWGRPHPLFWVRVKGVENRWIGGAVSPFAIHKCVWTEMNECAHLEILPGDLLRAGLYIREVLRERDGCAQCNHCEHHRRS